MKTETLNRFSKLPLMVLHLHNLTHWLSSATHRQPESKKRKQKDTLEIDSDVDSLKSDVENDMECEELSDVFEDSDQH